MDADVLVVGAGPTGLMLANQLARRGVRVLIIDRHAGPSLQTKALGVQARTMEIYAKLGVADRALELGKLGTGADIWAQGRRMARVPLGEAGRDATPYPFILILGQDDNERIMGDRLRDLGVSVQWSTELVGLEQEPDNVAVTLKLPDGTTRKMLAAWVAGCDGARSAVRELNGITFPGAPYEHVFFVADVEADGEHGRGRGQRLLVAGRLSSVLPHAREGSLADRRHSAAELARQGRREFRRCGSLRAQRSGAPACPSRHARGFPLTAFTTGAPRAFATAAASCSAMPRTFTARSARKA